MGIENTTFSAFFKKLQLCPTLWVQKMHPQTAGVLYTQMFHHVPLFIFSRFQILKKELATHPITHSLIAFVMLQSLKRYTAVHIIINHN